jgi:hypothetical protein
MVYGWARSSGRDAAAFELSAGGSIGLLAVNTASVALIPTVALGFSRAHSRGSAIAESGRSSLLLEGALGIVLRRGIAFRPGVVLGPGRRPRQWGMTAELSLNVPRR